MKENLSLKKVSFGSFNGKEFCHPYDTFDVPAGAWFFNNEKGKKLSNTSKFTTTIGIWIFNVLFIRDFGFAPIFGGYINKNIGNKEFNNINQELVYALAEDKIDAHTYVKFLDYTQFWDGDYTHAYVKQKILDTDFTIEPTKYLL